MSLETRHTEKKLLFSLYQVKKNKLSLDHVIAHLTAQMEPEDVKLVKQTIHELEDGKIGGDTL